MIDKFFNLAAAAVCCAAFVLSTEACASSGDDVAAVPGDNSDNKEYLCIAYAWEADGPLPQASMVTAVNYLAGYPNASRDGIDIHNEARLRQIVDLRKVNPSLKVLLSMGGNCYAGWPQLAASSQLRAAFAADCRRVIEQYGLDGIDFDWEFPGQAGGTSEDPGNFVLLMDEVRRAIGSDKLLTVAAGHVPAGLKFPALLENVDYVNLMTYDMGWQAPYHHTALRRSPLAGVNTVEEALATYNALGVPDDRIVLGLAFYGRGDGKNFTDWTEYRDIVLRDGMKELWDDVACVPYIVDKNYKLILGFENPRSLAIKCDFIKERGLKGGMYWRCEEDRDNLELTRTVARGLLGVGD